MTIDVIELGKVAGAITAVVSLTALVFRLILKPILDKVENLDIRLCDLEQRNNGQDWKISDLSEQNQMLLIGVSALLEGQIEQGCNGPVTKASERLQAYLMKRPFK